MSSVQIIHDMLDYNYSFQWRLWDCIMALSDEQYKMNILYSYGSVHNHMVHLAEVDGSWIRGLQGVPNARQFSYDPVDYPTRASARAICEKSAEEVLTYAAQQDEQTLQQTPEGMPLTIWQTLIHLVNHGTDHRAQVLRALHDFGASTFEQDFAFYYIKR